MWRESLASRDMLRAFRVREMIRSLRPHLLPLLIVTLACAVSQLVSFHVFHAIVTTPDTPTYEPRGALQDFLTHPREWIETFRTPGYPVFLAIVWAIRGPGGFRTVVAIQTLLTVLANFEIYAIVYHLRRARWTAAAVASLTGLAIWIVAWEHVIGTETLSFWLIVTIFFLYQRYLRTRGSVIILTVGVLCGMLVLMRPQFVLFPAVLLGLTAVRAFWMRHWSTLWLGIVPSLLIAYAMILGYMAANNALYGYFGLSFVSNVNLFGKVLEYHMQGESTNPRYAQLRQRADAWVTSGNTDPWSFFVVKYQEYWAHNVGELGGFATDIITHHPAEYAIKTMPDVRATLNAPPTVITQPANMSLAIAIFLWLTRLIYSVYFLLPLMVIGIIISGIRTRWREGSFFPLMLVLAVSYTVLTSAALSYDSFGRLRFPTDWAMILVGWLAIIEVIGAAWRARRVLLSRRRSHTGSITDYPSQDIATETAKIPTSQS